MTQPRGGGPREQNLSDLLAKTQADITRIRTQYEHGYSLNTVVAEQIEVMAAFSKLIAAAMPPPSAPATLAQLLSTHPRAKGMGDCTCHFRAYGDCDCGKDYRLPDPFAAEREAQGLTNG